MVPTLRREVAIHGADDKFAVKRYFNKSGSSWDLLCNSVLQTRFSNSLNKNWTPEMLQGSIVFSLHCAVFSSTCHKQGSHKEVAQNSILFFLHTMFIPSAIPGAPSCLLHLSRNSLLHLRIFYRDGSVGGIVTLWLHSYIMSMCKWSLLMSFTFWYILSVPSVFKHADWLFYFTIHAINKFKKIKEATWASAHPRAQELPNVEAESQHQTIKAREEEL